MTKSSLRRIARKKARKSAVTTDSIPVPVIENFNAKHRPTPKLSLEDLGPPGSLYELHCVPQSLDFTRSDQEKVTDAKKRTFEVSALLSKTPIPVAQLNLQYTHADGGSYLTFPAPRMAVDTSWGTIVISKNANGEASMLSMTCLACSPGDAINLLQIASATFLDCWAYEATAPVYMMHYRARDLVNATEVFRVTAPFRNAEIDIKETAIPTPLRPILALYREGLGSASALYKFLCFYKILEGYMTKLKPQLAILYRHAGLRYPPEKDLVPEHKELHPEFSSYVGRSITQFRNECLTPRFRDAVAHFEKDGMSPLIMSNPSETISFNRAAIAAELCARTVIESYRKAFLEAMQADVDLSSLSDIAGKKQ